MSDTMEFLAMENRGPTVLTVTIIMLCLSTVFIALRLISRIGVVRRISNDDYAIILAWVGGNTYPLNNMVENTKIQQLIAFGFSFSICYGTSVGLGRHEMYVQASHRVPLKKAEYAFSVLYVCTRDMRSSVLGQWAHRL